MRKLLFILALCSAAFAQGARYDSTSTTTTTGLNAQKLLVAIPGTQVFVCSGTYTGTPCTAAGVTVYSDVGLTQPIAQPIVSDSNGNFGFYAAAGAYYYTATPPAGSGGASGSTTVTLTTAAGSSTFSTITVTQNAALFQAHVNGDTSADVFGVEGSGNFSQSPNTQFMTVTHVGSGSSTWGYKAAELTGGVSSLANTQVTTVNASTLTGLVYNQLSVACNSTNDTVQFYRTLSGGSPGNTGNIGSAQSCSGGVASLNDTGISAGFGTPAIMNFTGQVASSLVLFKNSGTIRFNSETNSSIFNDLGTANINGGVNFHGPNVNISGMNEDGSMGSGTLAASFVVSGPWMLIPSGSGIGFGGAGTVTSTSAVYPMTYVGPGGATEYGELFTNETIGGGFPYGFVGPIEAFAVNLGNSDITARSSSITGASCDGNAQTSCSKTGLYITYVSIADTASCALAGPASATVSVIYTDSAGTETVTLPLTLQNGTIATSIGLGTGVNRGSGSLVYWSTGTGGATAQKYSVAYTACTTGTAKYDIHVGTTRIN